MDLDGMDLDDSDVDSSTEQDRNRNNGQQKSSSRTLLPTNESECLSGYQISDVLQSNGRLKKNALRSLYEGTIENCKLLLDESEHTRMLRDKTLRKINNIAHKPFRSAEAVIKQELIHSFKHSKSYLEKSQIDISTYDVFKLAICIPPS